MPWVTDHIFVAGGDFIVNDWATFQDQTGISAVVAIGDNSAPALQPPQAALLWLALAAESDYTLEQLRWGTEFIATALATGRQVLLYAPAGMHRTRPLVAAHLIHSGVSLARTLRLMEQKPWLPPYGGDATLLEEFLTALTR